MNETKTSDTDQAPPPVVEPRVGGATPPSAEIKTDEPDGDGKEHGRTVNPDTQAHRPSSADQDMATTEANRTGHRPARQDDGEIALQQLSMGDRCPVGSSRSVPGRVFTLQRSPLWSGFLLFVAGILTAPSTRSVLYSPQWAEGVQRPIIGVLAEPCENTTTQEFTVSSQNESNISSLFECDGGEFNVSWSGVIQVSSTITIGNGTTVRIFGESPSKSSNSGSNSYGLNVTQELTSVAARASISDPFGSIFFVQDGELHLENIAIRGRGNATYTNTTGQGGGVFASNSIVSISGCIFEENFAELKGGGIFTTKESTLILNDSVFRGNYAGFHSFAGQGDDKGNGDAEGKGGGIGCEETAVSIDGCLFYNNYASLRGGGAHISDSQASIVNSRFVANKAGSGNVENLLPAGEGGALSLSTCTHSFEDSLSHCSVTDTTFSDNTSGEKGGAVHVYSSDGYTTTIEFHRCLIANSTTGSPIKDDPQGEGGAFALGTGTHLLLEDCVVTKNTCGKKGGAFTLSKEDDGDPGAKITLRNSTFLENSAQRDDGGVFSLNYGAEAHFKGDHNNFTRNTCAIDGGVLSGTENSSVTVEGGIFNDNKAGEKGGVFWTRGNLSITGGNFHGNGDSANGGVVSAGEYSFVTLHGGRFENNQAIDGGVASAQTEGTLFVRGGVFSKNKALNEGGAFWKDNDSSIEITGGIFTENEADFGGFLYAQGKGNTSCNGSSVERHSGVDGGAIYAVDGAVVDWMCHLKDNKAFMGSAIYARDKAIFTIRDVNISNNTVARGSVVVVYSSTLYTDSVVFSDNTKASDLSAVQLDKSSTYVGREIAFNGFEGETVVYNEGILRLDDCDFSASSASLLVFSESGSTTVIRNANLDDSNFETAITEASEARKTFFNASLINVALKCSESSCSDGSICWEGDFGVYCQCYKRNFASEEVCLNGYPEDLALWHSSPEISFHPELLEADIVVHLNVSMNKTASSCPNLRGVMLNMSVISNDNDITWRVFPSVGLLHPGESIKVRVVGLPGANFDGTTSVNFAAKGIGARVDSANSLSSGSTQTQSAENTSTSATLSGGNGGDVITEVVDFTFYHCRKSSFWDTAESCLLCIDSVTGDNEGVNCTKPGATKDNLPIRNGYWRDSSSTTFIRKCFNEDACDGGVSEQDYCATGYEGPYCAVCKSNYAPGSGNSCHTCNPGFRGVMFVVFSIAAVITVIMAVLLGIYLVGGTIAVSKTVSNMKDFRGSDLFVISHFFSSESTTDRQRKGHRGFTGSTINMVSSADQSRKTDKDEGGESIGGVSGSATVSDTGPTLEIFPALVQENIRSRGGGGDVQTSAVVDVTARVEKEEPWRGRGVNARPLQHGDGFFEGVNEALNKSKGTGREGSGDGKRQEDTGTNDKSVATMIGDVLGKLPLSKLKIVIVVWQISTAFADISAVSFPAVYSKFLSFIGIFSFDLSWILSAACITVGLDFYDELLFMTIGPVVLLGLLCITFYLGARSNKLRRRNPFFGESSSGAVGFSTVTASTGRRRGNGLGCVRGGGQRDTAPESTITVTDVDAEAGSNRRSAGTKRGCCSPRIMHDNTVAPETASLAATATDIANDTTCSVVTCAKGTTRHSGKNKTRAEKDPGSFRPASRSSPTRTRSVQRVCKDGPGNDADAEENRLWWLFSRHTTVSLIILYLVYSSVSTVVVQTFACEHLDKEGESGKRYLRADFRIDCDTQKHKAYEIYAAIMIIVYPVGIPAAFWYFLVRQKLRINPPIDQDTKRQRGNGDINREKMEKRKHDPAVAPTSFLWAAYYPNRYYFEVCECFRRLLLTGLLVFLAPGTGVQVAYSCLFAFVSLFGFEMLRPHADHLDRTLYRTGCLVIFFNNFLALVIKANVADADSDGATAYSVGLVIVNIFFFLSIWGNTLATIKATFSRSHVQGVILGVDIVGEDKIDKFMTAINEKETKPPEEEKAVGEVKMEDVEAQPHWERDDSTEEPTEFNRRRCHVRSFREDSDSASVIASPPVFTSEAHGGGERSLYPSKSFGQQNPIQGPGSALGTWAITPLSPTTAVPKADNVIDSGPRSRGFPYASS